MSATLEIFDLTGQVAVITGGNGGLGLAMGKALARAGSDVAIWARNEERNAAASKELQALGVRAISVQCDVASPDSIDAAMATTVAELGRVDSCFVNAGIGGIDPFLNIDLTDFRRYTSVNLDGAFLTIQAAIRQMVKQGDGGSVIATSSLSALEGAAGSQAYAAAKAGMSAMIRGCAVEFARHGIRANSVVAGWFETEMVADILASEGMQKKALPRVPLRRWGRPEDLDGIAVYLASPASRFHTGDDIVIDGGYRIF